MTCDPEVIDALWAQLEPDVYITREQFEREAATWVITPYRTDDGRLAFVTTSKGPEFHFSTFNTGMSTTMRIARLWLAPLIERYGYVSTHVPIDDARMHRFCRTFGFKAEAANSEFFTPYRLDHLKCRRSSTSR